VAPAPKRRFGILLMAALLIPTPVAVTVTGCGGGCDTKLTATAGTAHRTGSGPVAAEISLDLSARLTSDGKGVAGVRIAFTGIVPGGSRVDAAGAVTGADGVAHYSGPADYGLANALTSVTTAQTISYVAQPMTLGSTPDAHICNLLSTKSPPADLRYQP